MVALRRTAAEWTVTSRSRTPAPLAVLTAFEPFGGRTRNRSWEVASRVALPRGVELVCLPVDFARLSGTIAPLLAGEPRAILLLGEAPTREVAVECVALNLIHARIADNAGTAPRGIPVEPGGPLALRSEWEGESVATEIRQTGVPVRVSFHAGTFACNAAMYHALHARSLMGVTARGGGHPAALDTKSGDGAHASKDQANATTVGFLHLPDRYRGPGTDLASLVRGVEAALGAMMK